jgi:hypothetical protein
MEKTLLSVALLGVALASTASAHPHQCYHPGFHYYWYPNYCYQDDDDDYYWHPHHHHHRVIFVP